MKSKNTVKRTSLLTIISGPSSVGKDTIIELLPKCYYRAVTATTRNERKGEVHGVHHYFVSPPEFRKMVQKNELLEWAQVYGNSYGVPKRWVRQNLGDGKHAILRVDVQGALRIREQFPNALLIFILPPTLEILKERMIKRGVNNDRDMKNRLSQAKTEAGTSHWFDYTVTNWEGRIERATRQVRKIIEHEELRREPVEI